MEEGFWGFNKILIKDIINLIRLMNMMNPNQYSIRKIVKVLIELLV